VDREALDALHARVAAWPGIAPDVAQGLIEATHQVCPYSRATHGNIAVKTKLV